tara:strand:- start:599 stop:943 length:345 start_codon:yes stop_codon:yes gene_type:complete
MKSRKCILPGLAKYRKDSPLKMGMSNEASPMQSNPIKKFKSKLQEFKAFKKKQHGKYNIMKTTVPDIPIGPGGIKKGKKAIDVFNKIAKNRAKQNKALQKSLEAKGYTFINKKK